MKTIWRTVLASFLFSALLPAVAAEGIAFLSNLKGEVAIDGNPRPTLLSEIQKGQRISVGADSQAAVMYIATGKEYSLKGPGEYLVRDHEVTSAAGTPPAARDTAWRTSNKVLAQVAQTSAASVRMRSIAPQKVVEEAKVIYPTQGAVSTLQPTFRWKAEPKDKAEFALFVVGDEKPVHSAKPTGAMYKVPAKLLPEKEYAWTVSVGGKELGDGKFRTLSADALARIESRRPAEKAEFSDRLLYTLMLQEMGATQEARESWAKLSQERSDLPELAAFAK
jgi:hypothetical protein